MGSRPDMTDLNERETRLIERTVALLGHMDEAERNAVVSVLEKILIALEGNRYSIAKDNRESSRGKAK
jgi:hypothetical protein